MSRLRLSVYFVCFSLFFALTSCAFAVEGEEAYVAIDRAESKLVSAYMAVFKAEEAGANVSDLWNELNSCVQVLSKVHVLYRVGNFDEAVYFANLCYDSVAGMREEANRLEDLAASNRRQKFLLTSLVSSFSMVCIVFGGILGWRFFKRQYCRQVLKSKPEVVQ